MQRKSRSTSATPFDLFLSLCEGCHPFILDSGLDPGRLGRFSFIGADPFLTLTSKGSAIRIRETGHDEREITGDPLEVLRDLLDRYPINPTGSNPPFIGGAVGYLGYDLCHFVEKLPAAAVDDVDMPDCFFGFYDGVYAFDHQTGVVTMTALGLAGDGLPRIEEMEARLDSVEGCTPALIPFHNEGPVSFHSNMTKAAYMAAIDRIKKYIRSGDIYQVNFTQRFDCSFTGDTVSFYGALRSINPAPFSAYIDTGEGCVLSSSPERFLHIRDGLIETRPIKGTCKRGKTPDADENHERDPSLEREGPGGTSHDRRP